MAISRVVFTGAAIGLAGMLVCAPGTDARRAGGPPAWDEQADRALGAGRGVGRQLMTEEEWTAHRVEMQTLQGEARETARRAWHEKMRERAKARGITIPDTPGPHRGGPGGMGRGGRGAGGPPPAE